MAADLDTKANKKLRELASLAYMRELAAELAKLEAQFARWRSGDLDPFALSDEIHSFHDGVARDLYKLYGNLSPDHLVARAPAREVLQGTDVPSELLAALESLLQIYRDPTSPANRPGGA